MSEQAKTLICKFCRNDPTQRLGYGRIDDARRDPWFQGFDFVAFRKHTMRPPIRPKVRFSLKSSMIQNFLLIEVNEKLLPICRCELFRSTSRFLFSLMDFSSAN